jgi:DNA-directed RNA polymerase specialized sigma24 family protein
MHAPETNPALIDKLSIMHRDVLMAKGSYQEIAESLGIPVGTVRSRLHRARAALARLSERHVSGDRVA